MVLSRCKCTANTTENYVNVRKIHVNRSLFSGHRSVKAINFLVISAYFGVFFFFSRTKILCTKGRKRSYSSTLCSSWLSPVRTMGSVPVWDQWLAVCRIFKSLRRRYTLCTYEMVRFHKRPRVFAVALKRYRRPTTCDKIRDDNILYDDYRV